MLNHKRIESAANFVEWLRVALHDIALTASTRTRAATSCLAIAQDHHHAIALLQNRLYASSFSLLRLELEAYVRGMWLALCATESEVESFLAGTEPPSFSALLHRLEVTPRFQQGGLSQLHKKHWRTMCDYTHCGGLHAQRWNTAGAIEPAYELAEVGELLDFAEFIAGFAAVGVAEIAGNEELCLRVIQKFEEHKARVY